MKRPTMRSLAKEAKVSAATVSMALRGSHEVSKETIQRIRKLATDRGYKPDPQVAKLMQHLRGSSAGSARTNLAALMQQWQLGVLRRHSYLHDLLTGIRTSVEALGFSLDIISMDELPEQGQLDRVLAGRGIEGLFLLPMLQPSNLRGRLDWSKYSVVSVTSSVIAPRFHQVTPNHFGNMVDACQQLKVRGCDRIGIAMSKEWDQRVHHRWAGGAAWYNTYVASQSVPPLVQDSPGPNIDVAAFTAWILREKPDAVIFESLNPEIIEPTLRCLKGHHRPVIAAMNWPSQWAQCGVDQRPRLIGAAAGETLAAMVARGERGVPESPLTIMVDGLWIWPEETKIKPARGLATRFGLGSKASD